MAAVPAFFVLLRKSLRMWWRGIAPIAVTVCLGTVPVQLLLAWALSSQGLEGDATWMMRYQGLVDLALGPLVLAAVLISIKQVLDEGGAGALSSALSSYRQAVGVWGGMFLTRIMVAFVLLVSLIPLLAGWLVVTHFSPAAARLLTEPAYEVLVEQPADLWPLLFLLPLGVGAVLVYLWYALSEVVVAVERKDGFEALRRSRALSKGARRQILGVLILFGIPLFALEQAVASLAVSHGIWVGAALFCVYGLAATLPATVLVRIHHRQSR